MDDDLRSVVQGVRFYYYGQSSSILQSLPTVTLFGSSREVGILINFSHNSDRVNS